MDMFFGDNRSDILFQDEPDIAIAYSAALSCAAVVGTVGNLLVICTIATGACKGLIGIEFFMNLAIADLIVTSLINPFAVVGVLEGKAFFADKYWLCKTLASICIISCASSLFNILLISVSRYVYVCHNSRYSGVYTRRNSLLMCSLAWIVGFLLDLPSHVGWSRHMFDEKAHKCLWDRNYAYSYSVFFAGSIAAILLVTVVFYLRIVVHVARAKLHLPDGVNAKRGALQKTMRQARIIILILVAFSLCWSPYILVILIDKNDTYPLSAHLFSSLVAHMHAGLNFVIYGLTNRRFLQGYKQALRRCFCPGIGTTSESSRDTLQKGTQSKSTLASTTTRTESSNM